MTRDEQVKLTSQQVGELVFEGRVAMACPIERAALRDARLSWAARGLFAFLWDLPEGWRPCLAHLTNMGIDRAHATRSAIAELEAVGAMRVEKLRAAGGRLAGQRWVVVSATRWALEAPLNLRREGAGGTESPESNFPSMEFSETRENRASENPALRVSKYKGIQIQGSTTTTTSRERGAAPVVVATEEDQVPLIWPAGLTEDQLSSMRTVLLGKSRPGPADAQALLDELAGQLQLGKVRNPPGLLRTLMKRQQDGSFTEDLGPEVRRIREARQKHQEREAAALAGKGQEPAIPGQQGSGMSDAAKRGLRELANLRESYARPPANAGRQTREART